MSTGAGYSGTPLAQKLGLKDGQRVLFIDLPEEVAELKASRNFAEVAEAGWGNWKKRKAPWDVIHLFTTLRAHLTDNGKPLMEAITRDGIIWVSWPKKASKVPTDITEDVIREVLLPIGLVDVKVAAVSEVWSGLKLCIRKELR